MHNSMASRTSPKIEPAVMTVVLNTPLVSSGATGEFTADLSQIASLVNRRFYRQGLNWAVAGMKLITTSNDAIITVKKLPNTWVMSNAWEKGMRAWLKMNREAMSETESVRPRYMDYKIHADETHYDAGFSGNLLPIDGQLPISADYIVGEWEASKMVIPFGPASPGNTNEVVIKAVGANYNGGSDNVVGLIAGYANSRPLPVQNDPSTPGDADDASGSTPENWLAATFNTGTDQTSEVLEDNLQDNDTAPYPFANDGGLVTFYPGGEAQAPSLQIHDISRVTGTTLSKTVRVKGGNFPCGLVRFDFANLGDGSANISIQVDLVPGSHRGYLCEPMTEM